MLTVADIQRAFAELPLPASTLVIQPPDGLTLVNFATNFYTTSTSTISTTVSLLGQEVTLEATPATFHWYFGDGESTSTRKPGAPYPDLTITHHYQRKGDYLPSLTTTYTGRYKIADGPWHTIPGTVTIDGTTQPLRAIEAQPKLVGY
ncbi:PKD domain-containing protein [Nocardioides humi]|uniref:PKD domain-containing protein n=1 Tax=Nocardioides humi TaxID=449461 RepID=UPI0015E85388|nr:PKD domain-containing protein [Nocardioides humi]